MQVRVSCGTRAERALSASSRMPGRLSGGNSGIDFLLDLPVLAEAWSFTT